MWSINPLFLWLYQHILAVPALAQFTQTWEKGTTEFTCVYAQGDNSAQVATIQGLRCLIGNVLSTAMTIIGLAGFVILIYGGFQFMLSGGQSKSVEKARGTLTFAIAGIVLALSAFIIINLISQFTGVKSISIFNLTVDRTVQ